jgi:hypothetical protein
MTTSTSPSRKRTPKAAQPVLLRRRSDGRIDALSSDGHTVYVVRLGTAADSSVSCECKGFQHYGRCRHIAAASQRYPAFWTPPAQPQPVSLHTTRATVDMLYGPGPAAA